MNEPRWEAGAAAWAAYAASDEGRRRTDLCWHFLQEYLPRGPAPLTCLDAGCGTGEIGLRLVAAGHRCTFLDLSPGLLAAVKAAAGSLTAVQAAAASPAPSAALQLVQGDVSQVPALFPAAAFDLVLAHSVLEFVPEPLAVLQGIARVLRPGGLLSVAVANTWGQVWKAALVQKNPTAALDSLAGQVPFVSAPFAITGRSFTPEEAVHLVQQAGLQPVARYGCRLFADDPGADPEQAAWLRLEIELGRRHPYRDMARLSQVVALQPLT